MRPCSMETEASEGKPTTSPTAKMCGDFGLVVLVDGDAAAIVGLKAGGGEVEVVDGALAADGVEQRVAGDFFLALQVGDDGAVGELFDAFHFFAQAHGDAAVAQVIAERFDDFLVGEFEQLVALFNEGDADAEDGEHAGVFDADDAAADDDERVGAVGKVENLVAVDDGAAVDGDFGRGGGLGADGDDDAVGFEVVSACGPSTRTWCGSTKRAMPWTTSMPLRESWASVTSTSVLMTAWTRKARSAMVIFSLTR